MIKLPFLKNLFRLTYAWEDIRFALVVTVSSNPHNHLLLKGILLKDLVEADDRIHWRHRIVGPWTRTSTQEFYCQAWASRARGMSNEHHGMFSIEL
jgi:hypothetical protein